MPKCVADSGVVPWRKARREVASVYPTCLEVKVGCCRFLCLRTQGVVWKFIVRSKTSVLYRVCGVSGSDDGNYDCGCHSSYDAVYADTKCLLLQYTHKLLYVIVCLQNKIWDSGMTRSVIWLWMPGDTAVFRLHKIAARIDRTCRPCAGTGPARFRPPGKTLNIMQRDRHSFLRLKVPW